MLGLNNMNYECFLFSLACSCEHPEVISKEVKTSTDSFSLGVINKIMNLCFQIHLSHQCIFTKSLLKSLSPSSKSTGMFVCVFLATWPVFLMFPVGSVLRSSGSLQGVSEWLLLTPGLLLTKLLCYSLPQATVSALSDLSFHWVETNSQLELRLANGGRVNMLLA